MISSHEFESSHERRPSSVTRLPPFSELMLTANRNNSITNAAGMEMRSRLSSTSSWSLLGQSRQNSASFPPSTDLFQSYLQIQFGLRGPSSDYAAGDVNLEKRRSSTQAYTKSVNNAPPGNGNNEYTTQLPQLTVRTRLGSLAGPGHVPSQSSDMLYELHEDIVRSVQLASRSLSEILVFQEMLELRCNHFMEKRGGGIRHSDSHDDVELPDQSAVLAFEDFLLYFSTSDLNECMVNTKNFSSAVEIIKRVQAEYFKLSQYLRNSASERMPRFSSHAPHHLRGSVSQVPPQLQLAAKQLQNLDKLVNIHSHASMNSMPASASLVVTPKKQRLSDYGGTSPTTGGDAIDSEMHDAGGGVDDDYDLGSLNLELSTRPNIACQHCASKKTPEWRRGPDGSRTLCNACGLFYSKMIKKYGLKEANVTMKERKRAGLVMDRHIT